MSAGFVNMADANMAAFAARNARRYVFYTVPQGAATLTGLMSLTDAEETDGPKFEWFEQRFKEKTALTTPFSVGVSGPWQNNAGVGGATIAFTLVTPGTTNLGKLKITSVEDMRNWNVGERITIHDQSNTVPAPVDVHGRITAVDTTNSILTILLDAAITVANASTDINKLITSEGVANAEGSLTSNTRSQIWPINPYNYTQIWRSGMSWSGTSAQQPMFFDIGGKGRTDRRDTSVAHLIELENSLIWGRRETRTTTAEDGTVTAVRSSGGILWHMELYESSGGGTSSDFAGYRPGQAALTANSDDDKRIVTGDSSNLVTNAEWKAYEERMFRTSMNSNNEKFGIGGSFAIKAICDYYEGKANIRITRPYADGYKLEFTFTTIETRYGTLHLKSHPRFNDVSGLKKQLLVVDMPNLKFRPMLNRDTHLNENIHQNGFDGRKDEYFTEGGFEVRFPESFMYFRNLGSIALT